jgi:phosphoribosylamine-glycine ligase
MLTGNGLRLVEYNFRPGDPEWMNTLCVLQQHLTETVTDLMGGKPQRATFAAEATVCKYIVPPAYPEKLHQTLKVTIPKAALRAHGVDVY